MEKSRRAKREQQQCLATARANGKAILLCRVPKLQPLVLVLPACTFEQLSQQQQGWDAARRDEELRLTMQAYLRVAPTVAAAQARVGAVSSNLQLYSSNSSNWQLYDVATALVAQWIALDALTAPYVRLC